MGNWAQIARFISDPSLVSDDDIIMLRNMDELTDIVVWVASCVHTGPEDTVSLSSAARWWPIWKWNFCYSERESSKGWGHAEEETRGSLLLPPLSRYLSLSLSNLDRIEWLIIDTHLSASNLIVEGAYPYSAKVRPYKWSAGRHCLFFCLFVCNCPK